MILSFRISSLEESEDDFSIWEKEVVKSPYDSNPYTSWPRATSVDAINKLLAYQLYDKNDISESVPFHVIKNATILVDLNQLKCRNDVKVDAWQWTNTKTYCKSSLTRSGPLESGDILNQFRIIERSFISKDNPALKKRIYATYKPFVAAKMRNSPDQYKDADHIVAVRYFFENGEECVPPSSKKRIYPSVKKDLQEQLSAGKKPKQALHQVKENRGGIGNISTTRELPNVKLAYNIQVDERNKEKEEDPLLKLVQLQKAGGGVVEKIIHNKHSFDIVLCTERIIHNIANFCCTDMNDFKSPLCWDFTFDLMKDPPSYALVLTYQFTTLIHKEGKTCPTLLGPILICHKKDEKTVKAMCDTLKDDCSGLEKHLKVLGADGENSILHQTCHAFPNALLLVCLKHIKDNISSEVPKGKKKQVMKWLSDMVLNSKSFDEFDVGIAKFYETCRENNVGSKFINYMKKNKEEILKFHAVSAAVNAAEIVGNPQHFYNNNSESINNLIKMWQGYKKVDMYKFAREYEEFVKEQENQIIEAFTDSGSSRWEVREEYKELFPQREHSIDYNLFSQDTTRQNKRKEEFIKPIINASFQEVMGCRVGNTALTKARANMSERISSTSLPASIPSSTNTARTVTKQIQDALPSIDIEVIEGSVSKAAKLVSMGSKGLMQSNTGSSSITQYSVASFSTNRDHCVTVKGNIIKCDEKCPQFKTYGFCAHSIAVAMTEQKVGEFVGGMKMKNLTQVSAINIGKHTGKKCPPKPRALKSEFHSLSIETFFIKLQNNQHTTAHFHI